MPQFAALDQKRHATVENRSRAKLATCNPVAKGRGLHLDGVRGRINQRAVTRNTGSMATRRDFLALLAAPAVLVGCVAGAPASSSEAEAVHRLAWRDPDPRFGGLSGLHLSKDGTQARALSDRGLIWHAQITRDASGHLVAVSPLGGQVLRDTDGTNLAQGRRDAEGLAIDRTGRMFVAFEGRPSRLLAYDDAGAVPVMLSLPPEGADWPANTGPEALALDPQGRLVIIPENSLGLGFPVYRQDGTAWQRVGQVPRRGDFLPVGADFGADGHLYLLERQFKRPFFASRISRIQPERWDQPVTLVQTTPGQFDNLEGISIGRTSSGRLRASCISDNNFNWFQRTELVEWVLG